MRVEKRKITDHFWFHEFSKGDPRKVSPLQWMMLLNLCNNLEIIRAFLTDHFDWKKKYRGRDMRIKVTNGIRLPSDNNRLRRQGYNPSETTDHFFGNIAKLRSKRKIRLYGKFYTFSVGAGDIVPGCGARKAWEAMKPYFDLRTGVINLPNGKVTIGQLILEKRRGYWLHIANHPSLIYSDQMVHTFLYRKFRFLISENNGATYLPLTKLY